MTDRIPLVLKLEHWPQTDRDLWAALFAEGGFLEDSGAGCTRSEGTRVLRRQAYGQWLSHLVRTIRRPPSTSRQWIGSPKGALGPS